MPQTTILNELPPRCITPSCIRLRIRPEEIQIGNAFKCKTTENILFLVETSWNYDAQGHKKDLEYRLSDVKTLFSDLFHYHIDMDLESLQYNYFKTYDL